MKMTKKGYTRCNCAYADNQVVTKWVTLVTRGSLYYPYTYIIYIL